MKHSLPSLSFLLPAAALVLAAGPDAQTRKLNAPLVSGGDVFEVDASRDGRWVAYKADQDLDGVQELYGVRGDGRSSPVKLSFGERALQFAISSDGTRVVFRADPTSQRFEIFSVPTDGSQSPVRLNPALAPTGDVGSQFSAGWGGFEITPDGSTVLFVAGVRGPFEYDLFSVPIDGSASATLLSVPTGTVWNDGITCDDAQVVYVQRVSAVSRLWIAPVDGSQPAIELTSSAITVQGNLRLSPDDAHAVFIGHDGAQNMLYAVPTDGSGPEVLIGGPISSYSSGELFLPVPQFALTDERVVFRTHATVGLDAQYEIYQRPIDASAPATKLNAPLPVNGDVHELQLSADGTRVVFRADVFADDVEELFVVPSDGSTAPVSLNLPLVAGGDVREFLLGRDRAIYRADQEVNETYNVYSVATTGGVPVRLNGGASFSDVGASGLQLSPGGLTVVYTADEDVNGQSELFGAPLDGHFAARQLSGPGTGHSVQVTYRLAGRLVFFIADQDVPGVNELYVSFLERPHMTR